MGVGVGNPGMDRKPEENIEFGCGIHFQSHVLGRASREWMLVLEILVWTDNSKRILSSVEGFSFKVRCWEEPIGVDVGVGNPGMDRTLEENIEFGYGILNQSGVLGGANREWMFGMEIRV